MPSPNAATSRAVPIGAEADRPALGITLMLGFCFLAPFADALVKLVGAAVPLAQLVAVRFVVQAVLCLPLALVLGARLIGPPRVMVLVFIRAILQIAAVALFFLALRAMPLADAVAIAFVMPFLVLLLGWAFLGEEVGWRRLSACGVGLIGTLMVVQPAFVEVGAVALLPLSVALIFALFMLITREISSQIGPIALQAANGVIGSAALLPLLWLAGGTGLQELDPIPLDLRLALLLAAIGVFGTLSHLFLTWSLRVAPASSVAPVQYLEIPMAALLGWLFFRDWPGPLALAGIALIVGAGLAILLRERALTRSARP